MDPQLIGEIVRDAALLLALVLVLDVFTAGLFFRARPYRVLLAGLAVGLLAIGAMATPYHIQPGVTIDARSVLLAVSGLVLGAGATLIGMVIAAAYRLFMGGSGALVGVLVIASSGMIGIAYRAWRREELETIRRSELYALGLIVHLVMLALLIKLPAGMGREVVSAIALPVLLVFPVATMALGSLLINRLRRERLAVELKTSEARYRGLFENSHAIMLVIDPVDATIVDANPAAARFYGWSREELTGRSILEINILSEEEAKAEMERARLGERAYFRFQHRLATGVIRDVNVMSGEVVVDGRPLLYSIIQDVSAERQAMADLRLRSAALDAAASAIVITDRDGAVEWVNAAFTEFYGYSLVEAVGENPRDLVKSGAQDPEFYAEMWDMLLRGETWRGRLINRRKDGSHIEEEMVITPLRDETGEIAHFIAVKQDLTERKALEERLAMAQKLESVGRLAGGVAHDFNNLLTVINNTVDLAMEGVDEDHPLRSDLEGVRQAGERARILTRQLLAFGRRQVSRKEPLELNTVILEMNKMLGRLIGEDIAVVTDLDEGALPVFADRSQLEQVIMNLGLNGRDAMPTGGTLTISTEMVEDPNADDRLPKGQAGAPQIRLRVRDTGVGINPEIRDRIFDPFFTTKEPGKGTGLGLATVYGIVTETGGDIRVDSTLGRGTTFEVRLPVAATKVLEKREDRRTVSHDSASGTILVVEDDPAVLGVAARILQRAGYTVLTAESGPEAMDLLKARGDEIDLMFTDMVMPGMSGLELVKQARELAPRLRVLLSSGYTDEVLNRHRVTGDTRQFIGKPYTIEGLTEKVSSVLKGEPPSP